MVVVLVFAVLLVVGFGILGFLTGDMTAWIAMVTTFSVGCGITGVLHHVFKPREKRIDIFHPLSPTLRWMNTAGSILLAANRSADFRLLGGYGRRIEWGENREGLQKSLWEYWGIQGHVTAVEKMGGLLTEGMRAQYRRDMELLSRQYQGYTEEQLVEEARKTDPNADEDSYLPKMLLAWRRYGENALLGWDMGRCAYLVQWCYLAGYLDMQTMLDIGVEAGKKAQSIFQNWEEMMESYLLGVQYWQHEDRNTPGSMTAERWALYRKLWYGKKPFRESPYVSTPFDLPLSKEILTDEYGTLLESQTSGSHSKRG